MRSTDWHGAELAIGFEYLQRPDPGTRRPPLRHDFAGRPSAELCELAARVNYSG